RCGARGDAVDRSSADSIVTDGHRGPSVVRDDVVRAAEGRVAVVENLVVGYRDIRRRAFAVRNDNSWPGVTTESEATDGEVAAVRNIESISIVVVKREGLGGKAG